MFKRSINYPFVTMFFVVVCILVYLLEVFLGGSQNSATLLKLGAMNNQVVVEANQWWRLFTAQFLHIGIMHLVSNIVMIYYFGAILEPFFGHTRFFFYYILSGIGGNLLSLAYGNDFTLAAGASTSLFGLFGTAIMFKQIMPDNPIVQLASRQAFVLAVINLALDTFMPNIDIFGHLGGLITGMLLVTIFGCRFKFPRSHKVIVIAVVILIIYVLMTIRRGMVITY